MTNAEALYESAWTICGIVRNGSLLVRDYIDGLADGDRKRILARLERASFTGPSRNDQTFKKVQGEIFEIKAHQQRLFCFFDGERRLVITHGYTKKKNRLDKEEIARAIQLMNDYKNAT